MKRFALVPLLLLAGCAVDPSSTDSDHTAETSSALTKVGTSILNGPITTGPILTGPITAPVSTIGGTITPVKVPIATLVSGCTASTGIIDAGYPGFQISSADVNGDGVDDYCRFVGDSPNEFLSCQLGCGDGKYGAPYGFSSITGLDQGYSGQPRWLTDINGDGRADFCRWVGDAPNEFFSCDLAGTSGFDAGEYEVSLPPNVQPLVLTIEEVEPATPVENRPMYIHFALTNNLPFAQKGFVGGQMFPKHGSEYNNVWGEWQVYDVPTGQTVRGAAEIAAPRADTGVSANVYFVEQHALVGEFDIVEGPHLVESAPSTFDVLGRYSISLDTVNINHTRALHTDTDYVGLTVKSNGATVYDNSASPLFIGNIQDGVHPIGLSSGTFDLVPSDSESVDIAWTVLNNGAHAEQLADKILNGVSSIAAGVLSIAYPGTGQTWAKVDDFTEWLNSQQFAGCDGPAALDHMTATSNVLEYKTYDDQSTWHDFADVRYYDWTGKDSAYNSQDGCGSSPRYAVNWTLHRNTSPVEIETTSVNFQQSVKPNGTVQFGAVDSGVHWSVDGDAFDVGWIDDNTGLYHAPASLPISTLIEVRVETADGSKHGIGFVSLDPR